MFQENTINSVSTVRYLSDREISNQKRRNPIMVHETNIKDSRIFSLFYNNGPRNIESYEARLINLNRIKDIENLEKDWDGYGAEKIPKTVVYKAITFVEYIQKQPVIYPTGRESIHMQYELDDRSYLEFEIFENRITCMKVPQRIYEKATFDTFYSIDMNKFNQIVEAFYERQN